MKLRDYQQQAIDKLRQSILGGARCPVLQLPTGGGKTHIATEIIRSAVAKGKRVLFLAPRRELIYQASGKFDEHGIIHGIIMAGEAPYAFADVQVASFDTLHARAVRSKRINLPPADVVVVDEAHLSIAKTKADILKAYPSAIIVGLTATPARGDGRGLGEIYDDLVQTFDIAHLTERGYLAPARYFAPSKPDLAGLKVSNGDYVTAGLAERVDTAQLVGDVVHNWRRIASDRQTVVFCVNRAHSRHVCEQFNAAGFKAEHLDGETPNDERKAILGRVSSGETQILCNVFVATFGLDIPSLSCAVLARPTKNISLYLQTCGRVIRTHEGKTDAIIIDHSGAIEEHGYLDEYIPWSLDSQSKIAERKKKAQEERQEPKEIICAECGASFKSSRSCPECGHEMIPPSKPIPTHQADLQELSKDKRKNNREWSKERKARKNNREWSKERKAAFFGGLAAYGRERGYKPGWAKWLYREKFGVWPNAFTNAPLVEPNEDVTGWITHQRIAYAKRRNVA